MYRKYFLSNGLQYYVAGRTAIFAGFWPIAGNLFHHGIELLLKYLLLESETLNSDQLKRRFRHDLNKLWKRWKSQQKEPTLDQFDDLVSTLHEWEEIRYPRPGVLNIGYESRKSSNSLRKLSHSPREYLLPLEALDELVFVLLNNRVSPDWIFYAIGQVREGRTQYERENLHILP